MNKEPMQLPVVNCCATCKWFRGWCDNAWCEKHQIGVLSFTKCDTFERTAKLPLWIVCEPVERKP